MTQFCVTPTHTFFPPPFYLFLSKTIFSTHIYHFSRILLVSMFLYSTLSHCLVAISNNLAINPQNLPVIAPTFRSASRAKIIL